MQALGHSLIPAFPSGRAAPHGKESWVSPLKGVRCRGKVTLLLDAKSAASSQGEIQFTEEGLSGICVFELSRAYGEYAQKGGKAGELSCDLMPEYSVKDISLYLRERIRCSSLPADRVVRWFIAKADGERDSEKKSGDYELCMRRSGVPAIFAGIARQIKDIRFPITGTAGWEAAQVTAGGIPLREVNLQTMESRRCPGVYLAGELLNIDGDCGGYNLHWAWSTGYLAGISAAAEWRQEYGCI